MTVCNKYYAKKTNLILFLMCSFWEEKGAQIKKHSKTIGERAAVVGVESRDDSHHLFHEINCIIVVFGVIYIFHEYIYILYILHFAESKENYVTQINCIDLQTIKAQCTQPSIVV